MCKYKTNINFLNEDALEKINVHYYLIYNIDNMDRKHSDLVLIIATSFKMFLIHKNRD